MPQDWFEQNKPQQQGGDWFEQNAPETTQQQPQAPQPEGWWNWIKRKGSEFAKDPASMGMAGAMAADGVLSLVQPEIGIPTMIALNALGGAGGAAIADVNKGDTSSIGSDMLTQGALNGLMSAAPSVLSKAGKAVYSFALPAKVLREFPNAAEVGMREIPNIKNGARINERLGKAGADTLGAIREADAAGAPKVAPNWINQPFTDSIDRIKRFGSYDKALEDAPLNELKSNYDTLANKGMYSLEDMQETKRVADEIGSKAYQADHLKQPLPYSQWYIDNAQNIGNKARNIISEGVKNTTGKDIGALNARTQALLGLSRASWSAQGAKPFLGAGLTRHIFAGGIGGYEGYRTSSPMRGLMAAGAIESLGNPRFMSGAGYVLDKAARLANPKLVRTLGELVQNQD